MRQRTAMGMIRSERSTEPAKCRSCGKVFLGKPWHLGGFAFEPVTKEPAKANHYGGWVCSAECDYRASLELEQTMPGHGLSQKTIGCSAMDSYRRNWDIR